MNDLTPKEGSVQIATEGIVRCIASQETPLRLLLAADESLQVAGPWMGRFVNVDRTRIDAIQYSSAHWLRSSQFSEQAPAIGIFILV
jgi:hypothetical protein